MIDPQAGCYRTESDCVSQIAWQIFWRLRTKSQVEQLRKDDNRASEDSHGGDEEKEVVDTLILSDVVYEGVMKQLKLGDDALYNQLVLNMLKRQTKDHIVFSIWNNLSDDQAKHLRQYINQTSKTAPWMRDDDVLMEFAQMYPYLMEKVFAGLTNFFQRFIDKFNEISEA